MEPESPDSAGPASDERALRELSKLAEASKGAPRSPSSPRAGVVDLAAIMAEPPSARDGGRISSDSLAPPSLASFASIAPMTNEALGAGPAGAARGGELPLILGILGAGVVVAAVTVFALRVTPLAARASAAVVAAPQTIAAPPPPAPIVAGAAVLPASPTIAAAPPPETAPVAAGDIAAPPAIAPAPPPETAQAAPPAMPTLAKEGATTPPHAAHARRGSGSPPRAAHAFDAALRAASDSPPAPAAVEPAPARAAKVAPEPASERLPERPSGSALKSSLGGLLPAARACLAGMAEPSHALVTFSGDGSVLKIEVTGPAAGNAKASQCVRGAFGRAHVPAFAQSVYSAGLTIRPE